jgi:RNA polymerase sigma-70 factor, ECF subfamily
MSLKWNYTKLPKYMRTFILNEEETLVAFSKGDAMAFEAIYKKYHTNIYFVAKKYLNDDDDAKDVRANSFIKIWEMHDTIKFDSMRALYGWLRKITANSCIDYLRMVALHASKEEFVKTQYFIEHQYHAFELSDKEAIIVERIRKQIEALPKSVKDVFKMRLSDMKFKEIAAALHADISTIKKRYARALTLINRGLNFCVII